MGCVGREWGTRMGPGDIGDTQSGGAPMVTGRLSGAIGAAGVGLVEGDVVPSCGLVSCGWANLQDHRLVLHFPCNQSKHTGRCLVGLVPVGLCMLLPAGVVGLLPRPVFWGNSCAVKPSTRTPGLPTWI